MRLLQLPRSRQAEQFAGLLEHGRAPAGTDPELADLARLARSLVPAQHAPREEFRSSLRDRLVAEAAERPVVPVPAPRRDADRVPAPPRLRHAVATLTVAAVVTGAGVAAASTQALPGDVLYGLKRQIENAQLALARSDLDRGREHLEQAEERLSEAEQLAASVEAAQPGTRVAISDALAEMERATEVGAAELTASYRDTGDREPMELLDRFLASQQVRVTDLMSVLDPALRARLAAYVDELARLALEARGVLGERATAASDAGAAGSFGTGGSAARGGTGIRGERAAASSPKSGATAVGSADAAGVADGLAGELAADGSGPTSATEGRSGPISAGATQLPTIAPPVSGPTLSPSVPALTPSLPPVSPSLPAVSAPVTSSLPLPSLPETDLPTLP